MTKKKYQKILPLSSINFNNYSVCKVYLNGAILYRCKFCFNSRIKKDNNIIIRISGHMKNCNSLRKKDTELFSKCKGIIMPKKANKNFFKTKRNLSSTSAISSKSLIISDETKTENNYFNHKIKKVQKNKHLLTKIEQNNILLKKVFNKKNHLNKFEEEISQYYLNRAKIIGSGASTKTYLGEDKLTKDNVAILEIKKIHEEKIYIENYILHRIHGKGNFPQLYMLYGNEEYAYFIENLMGPNLNLLFNMCLCIFDIHTVLNIGIDLISNLKILHNIGVIHRDLKPDNLTDVNLCRENYKFKNQIGIIDFGNAKLLYGVNGEIKYSKKN